jgi:hypothetical protein
MNSLIGKLEDAEETDAGINVWRKYPISIA